MNTKTAVWAALMMATVTLAGCTGGGQLDMLVTPAEDSITEPFVFKATGPSYDHYEWDFGDGSSVEGKEVEHIFGFTDGDIIVRLTGHNEGEDEVVVPRTIPLGGSRNVNPNGVLTVSTFWVNVGDTISLSTEGTSDDNSDPLLYRWTCERKSDLLPVDTSHPPHGDFGGVPFGVDAWGTKDPAVSGGTDFGSTLCSDLDSATSRPWSTTDSAVQGSFTEPGTYVLESFVRDPKGAPWIGRANVWVADPARPIPGETASVEVTGVTLQGGFQNGGLQAFYNGETIPEGPVLAETGGAQNLDRYLHEFTVDIASLSGEIIFDYSGPTVDNCLDPSICTSANYRIYTKDGGNLIVASSSQGQTFGKDKITQSANGSPRDLVVEFQITPAGAEVSLDFEMNIVNDLDPLNWYELPPL